MVNTLRALGVLALFGCSLFYCSEGQDPMPLAQQDKLSSNKAVKMNLGEMAPCTVLTPEIVAAEFQMDASHLEAKPFGKKMCTYAWPKPNQAEIDQKNEALMADFLKQRLQAMQEGKTLEQPAMENSHISVSLTLVDMKDESRAGEAFNRMIETVANGISAEKDGVKATFRMTYDQTVTDVGDQAAWSSASKQLSFRLGSVFLHISVDQGLDSAINLQTAKSLAKRLIATL